MYICKHMFITTSHLLSDGQAPRQDEAPAEDYYTALEDFHLPVKTLEKIERLTCIQWESDTQLSVLRSKSSQDRNKC